MLISAVSGLLLLLSASIESRKYPCGKWCYQEQSSSSSNSHEKHNKKHDKDQCENKCPTGLTQQDCLQFDTTMFATSIDEALYNFPNLVSNDKKPMFTKTVATTTQAMPAMRVVVPTQQQQDIDDPSVMSSPPMVDSPIDYSMQIESTSTGSDDDCSSVSCQSCKLYVINGFLSGTVDAQTNATLWATKESLEASLNGITPSCPQNQAPQNPMGRGKRQANSIVDSAVGSTQTISCDYTRGNPVSTDTRFCGLCSLCWGWRQLPEDYFPTYLNEVTCSTDTICLQGFGRCNSVTRSINVLRKKYDSTGAFKYEQTTIDTVTSCECQVEYGSTMFNLVYANDIN